MYCASCGAQVATVSYDPCPRCGNPTNGAPRGSAIPAGKSNTSTLIIVLVVVLGGIVVFGGILAAIAIPNMMTAMNRAKQKRTMADLRSVATALESYGTEKSGFPNGKSYDELRPLLVPEYIHSWPAVDGWGHPFRYACAKEEDGHCTTYVLASAGKDGVFSNNELSEYVASPPGATTHFDCDIVFSNGNFLEYPEGVQH
jgi:general secretion pathway protein G